MANPLCFASLCSLKTPYQPQPGLFIRNSTPGNGIGNFVRDNELIQSSTTLRFRSFRVKATTGGSKDTKVNSILCPDCDGNGAVHCSQCKGTGVNSVDHFNGQFKAGGLCWLCRGKRDILCGNCNGAGFVGGFMSTSDE